MPSNVEGALARRSEGGDQPVVVGIGASAGGLVALRAFFSQVQPHSGMAFVVVVHLSPDHESYLPELLQSHSRVPVQQVTATVPLEADNVYIIPPGSYLSTIDTHVRLSELQEQRFKHGPIDHFFETLAAADESHCVGIVLTGTGTDGTSGIKAIKEKGGLVVVQDPSEAEYDGMPKSAIATGMVDLILPVADMPEQILRICSIHPMIHAERDGAQETKHLERLFALVNTATRRDFSRYKRSTLIRRIQRRMQLKGVEELAEYLNVLREDSDEVRALADEMLVTVTSFFRDPEVFEALEEHVVPRLFEDKTANDSLRLWSVGCATGEEAYSLAILLMEAAERRVNPPKIQVFASDLLERSLRQARDGLYTSSVETEVSPERRQRFFTEENGHYRIQSKVREHVVFALHNFLADPPFSKLDMVICRNVLIYLDRSVQREVIELFHFALNPGGLLVLGQSEKLDDTAPFHALDKSHSVYQRNERQVRDSHLPVYMLSAGERTATLVDTPRASSIGEVHNKLVERYAPPSLLLDAEGKVVYVSEHAGQFLRVPGGELTAKVLSLVHDQLRLELNAALHEVKQRQVPVRTRPVDLEIGGTLRRVVLHVRPTDGNDDGQKFTLVLFDDWQEPQAPGNEVAGDSLHDERHGALLADLEGCRQRLQSIMDEHATNLREMQCANEELQSANEELRSTMEELETSREELQSINEELTTLNQENRHKVEELNRLTSDLQNLMVATGIPTLFLDRNLCIVRFTPSLAALFNLRDSDRGRPVSDQTHRLQYDDLAQDARRVLEHLSPISREVQDESGNWYNVRVQPYRLLEDRIDGVVVTFFDVTDQKNALKAVSDAKQYAEDIVETVAVPLLVLHPNLRVKSANQAFLTHFGVTLENTIGRLVYDLGNGQWNIPELQHLLEDVLPNDHFFIDYEVRHHFENLGDRVFVINGRRLDHIQLILLGFNDVTNLKRVEWELREADRRKDEFLATLAHELRNPLAPIRNGLEILKLASHVPETVEETRNIIERQTRQLITLVDDLLDVSRITRGKLELRRARVLLKDVLTAAIEASQPCIEEAGLHFTINIPAEPIEFDADPHRLAQVISNLLNNAAKFTPAGGNISLVAEQADDGIRIAVQDSGVGIPAEMLKNIFDMFTQIKIRSKLESPGLGIGLSLVKALVEMHGGRVEAQSGGLEKGSTFVIHLPVSLKLAALRTAPQHPETPTRSLRILVVDDNQPVANTLAKMVCMLGHVVQVAYSGLQALDMGLQFHPELILLDLGIPRMNGFETARRIREQPWGDKVTLVAVTGWGSAEDRDRTMKAGFDYHLVKPAELEELEHIFASLAAKSST